MSVAKNPSIFSKLNGSIVFIILQAFFVAWTVLKIGEWLGNIWSHDVFRPVVHERKFFMDQYNVSLFTCTMLAKPNS